MRGISPEVKADALKRCFAECGEPALNQSVYARWRDGLPNPRSVPSSFAFGDVKSFAGLCSELGIPVLKSKGRRAGKPVFMSDRQLRAVARRFVAATLGPYARGEFDVWRAQRLAAGESVPSFGTIEGRLGSFAAAFTDDELPPSRDEVYWRDVLVRVAREIGVVESESGVSPVEMKDWRAVRSARPDLGLYAANTVVRFQIMPWRQLVASDRSWPSDIDGLVQRMIDDSRAYSDEQTDAYWRSVLTRVAREVAIVEAAGFPAPLMREWDAVRVDGNPEMFKADSVSRLQIMPWRELVASDRTWPDDIEGWVVRMIEGEAA